MNNYCKHLKLRQKKYRKFLYCDKAKKEITLENCKCCCFKEKCKKKVKRDYNQNSIICNFSIQTASGKMIFGFGNKIPYYHKHHIFEGTGTKALSEKYGLFFWIAPQDHLACFDDSFHNNIGLQKEIKKMGQKAFMQHYPELDFVKIFGQNYL